MSWIPVHKFPIDYDLGVLEQNLRAAKIPHQFTDELEAQVLWVPDKTAAEKTNAKVAQFLQNPQLRNSQIPVQVSAERWAIPSLRQTPLTYILLFLSIVGYGLSFKPSLYHPLLFFPIPMNGFVWPAAWHYWLATGEYWRFISPTFLHWSAVHIIFNAIALVDFGGRLERVLPRGTYLGLFLFTALAANFGQFTFVPQQTGFGGISGALFGYFGCILALQWLVPQSPLHLPKVFVVFSLAMLAAGFFGLLDRIIGPMANGAHLVGLIAGFIYGLMLVPILRRYWRNKPQESM